MMDDKRLQEIKARGKAATPGDWVKDRRFDGVPIVHNGWMCICNTYRPDVQSAINAEFIAHARTDIPDLIAEVERLREEQRLWSDGSIIVKLGDLETENTRLRAELEAAKQDMRELSGHYKICKFCMYDKGGGVSDCKDYKCDSENHYVWRGLCAENGGTK